MDPTMGVSGVTKKGDPTGVSKDGNTTALGNTTTMTGANTNKIYTMDSILKEKEFQ